VRGNHATLLSVRPRFAEAILDGSKTVEVRRRRVWIADGSLCLLYASSPMRALVGAVRVRQTAVDTPEDLWLRWGGQTGLTRNEYDEYIEGSVLPCAIVVDAAMRLRDPVPLDELRRRQGDFVTPQSYRFLDSGEFASLTNGQAHHLEGLAITHVASGS
jgi:predicted transcriptional regulator